MIAAVEPVEGERVYILQRAADQHFKIGVTGNLRGRLQAFRNMGMRDLRLVCSVPGSNWLELQLHAYLEPDHVANEWFRPSGRVLKTVLDIASGAFDWSELPAEGWCITRPFQTRMSIAHWGELKQPDGRAA